MNGQCGELVFGRVRTERFQILRMNYNQVENLPEMKFVIWLECSSLIDDMVCSYYLLHVQCLWWKGFGVQADYELCFCVYCKLSFSLKFKISVFDMRVLTWVSSLTNDEVLRYKRVVIIYEPCFPSVQIQGYLLMANMDNDLI